MLCSLSLVAGLVLAADAPKADLVLLNGKVWTVDKKRAETEAVAVWRDRILAVGTTDEVKKLVGPRTRTPCTRRFFFRGSSSSTPIGV